MAEDFEDAAALQADAPAIHAALSSAGTSAEAREYLKKQSRIADIQIDTLEKKDAFELTHLRFRRFSDYSRFSLEIAGFLVVLLIVCGLGTMVWNAARDRGLVVDSFSVPPEMAQQGLTGSVVANRLIDRYGALLANSFSVTQGGEATRRDGADEVRVEIPDTGVSLGEIQRYLRDWLGHDTHVAGEVVRTPKGYSFTVRYGDQPGVTLEGADLDALMAKSAERLMQAALPYRHVEYLARHGRGAEALPLLPALVSAGNATERGRAYAAWASIYFYGNEMQRAGAKATEGLKVDPQNPLLLAFRAAAEGNLGHDESSRDDSAAAVSLWRGPALEGLDPNVRAVLPVLFSIYRDEPSGDYAAATAGWQHLLDVGAGGYDAEAHTADAIADHDFTTARRTAEGVPPLFEDKPNFNIPESRMLIAYGAGDWAATQRFAAETGALLRAVPDQSWQYTNQIWPIWAEAKARSGDIAGAEALIAKTPRGCDICTRMRGRIAAAKGDYAGAARWFALASGHTPRLPLADTDWGAMLMRKGDPAGAIAKFQSANQKGPHFADPLEGWGEALMMQNRSDLALVKFEEADRYAPNWGRLHLKWGEALFYAGRTGDAEKQFAVAAGLDLTPPETSQLKAFHG
jgi:tetratricopeptide (TPR) repeat protein